ncbi:MAG: hypothetical protein JJU06_18230 [Ectothiorhodospiraceae bacterium]|nr:hypothetical protein [Ectothiorhodospiraceae bacterium]MCH8504791.1 hypothetical protein [Ectothiorhodospiraceae bacterium]
MTDTKQRTRGRLQLILVLAVFFVPASIAWTLFFTGWTPTSTGNYGDLVQPPHQLQPVLVDGNGEPVPVSALRGKWTLLIQENGACGDECSARLSETRQIRLALAQRTDRTQRVLVLPEGSSGPDVSLLREHPDLRVYWRTGELLPDGAPGSVGERQVSVLDTRGYRMMHYPEPMQARGVLEDLKHLIRLSNIDLERLQGLSDDA